MIIIDGVYIYKDNDIDIYNHYDNYNSLLPLRLQWLMSIMIITSSFIFYNLSFEMLTSLNKLEIYFESVNM